MATTKETKLYKLLRGSHTRQEEDGTRKTYRANTKDDRIALTKVEAKFLKGRVQLIGAVPEEVDEDEDEEGSSENVSGDEGAESVDWSALLSSLSAADAVSTINQLDTVEDIEAAKSAEQESATPRRSVIAAADKRIAELSK